MSIREVILESTQDLRHQVQVLQGMLGRSRVAPELTPFRGWVEKTCGELRPQILDVIRGVREYPESVLPEMLQESLRLRHVFEVVNTRFASVVIRGNLEDRLGLLVLRWLHDTHAESRNLAFGLTDGDIAVWPTTKSPPIYLLPPSRQRTLLYLPLVFHEYGHTLYALHRERLLELGGTFEELILAESTARRKRVIAGTWVNWLHELFCDAVGLRMCGPAFLDAYSHFFRLYLTADDALDFGSLVQRSHPPSWLRTEVLLRQAMQGAPTDLMTEAIDRLNDVRHHVVHFHGTKPKTTEMWSMDWMHDLRKTLDQMVKEVEPRAFDVATDAPSVPKAIDATEAFRNPVALCHAAWSIHNTSPIAYRGWERRAVRQYLQSH